MRVTNDIAASKRSVELCFSLPPLERPSVPPSFVRHKHLPELSAGSSFLSIAARGQLSCGLMARQNQSRWKKAKGPRFLSLIMLVFFCLIFSPSFKDLSAWLGARPRCKGPPGAPRSLSISQLEYPRGVESDCALMAFVMANYKAATRGKINRGWSWGLGYAGNPRKLRNMKRAALVTMLTLTYKPCDVTAGCVFVARGQCDRRKIIIICNINELFCQLFQRHHHSCANRLGGATVIGP